jgi:predicted homoserine dehydrogenase-like protein
MERGDRVIERVGIVGAGFMGSGVAEVAALAGMTVLLRETGEAALERSRERIGEALERAVGRGRLQGQDAAAAADRLSWATDLDALTESELVIEAIVEDAEIKGRCSGPATGSSATTRCWPPTRRRSRSRSSRDAHGRRRARAAGALV